MRPTSLVRALPTGGWLVEGGATHAINMTFAIRMNSKIQLW